MHYRIPLLIASLSLAPIGAQADLEEIIVSAQKRARSIDDLPISMSVIPGRYLETQHITTLEDLSANFPSVYVAKNSGATKLFMRGVGSQGNAGMDQAVATFVDEIYHGRSRTTKSALVDLERIEILRGPQGIYFGGNASAGAISIHTRSADTSRSEGFLLTTLGTDGELSGTVVYNKPFSDSFAMRAVADATSLDGYWTMIDPGTGEETGTGGGEASNIIRISSIWQPGERLSARLKMEVQDIERDNPFAWQPRGCDDLYGLGLTTEDELDSFWAGTGSVDPNPLALPFSCQPGFVDNAFDHRSPAHPYNESRFDAREAVLTVDWQLGFATLTSITGHFDMDFTFEGNDLSHGSDVTHTLWSQDDSAQTSEELRLISHPGETLDWMLGAYFHAGNADYQIGNADGRNLQNPQYARSSVQQDERVRSLFAALTWRPVKQLDASFGLRWTRTDKTFSGLDTLLRANALPMPQRGEFGTLLNNDVSGDPSRYSGFAAQTRNQFVAESRSFDDLLPTFELAYRSRDSASLYYYKWSKGFKSGGFNFRLSGLEFQDLTYDSETVGAHEIGYKATILDNRLRLSVAAFSSEYRDLQQNSSRGDDGGIAAAVIRNAAEARSEGIELDASWQLSRGLRLDLSSTWLDARFEDYQGADCTRLQSVVSRSDVAADFSAQRAGNRCFQDLDGARMPFAPEFTSRVGLGYDFPSTTAVGVTMTFEWLYSDEFFTSPHADPLRQQDAFHKFNARFEFGDTNDRWNLALIASNLGDTLTARQLGQDDNAAVSGLVDPPRRFYLQARYSF